PSRGRRNASTKAFPPRPMCISRPACSAVPTTAARATQWEWASRASASAVPWRPKVRLVTPVKIQPPPTSSATKRLRKCASSVSVKKRTAWPGKPPATPARQAPAPWPKTARPSPPRPAAPVSGRWPDTSSLEARSAGGADRQKQGSRIESLVSVMEGTAATRSAALSRNGDRVIVFAKRESLSGIQIVFQVDQHLIGLHPNDAVLRGFVRTQHVKLFAVQIQRDLMIGAAQGRIRDAAEGAEDRAMNMPEEHVADAVLMPGNGRHERTGVAQRDGVHAVNANRKERMVHEDQHRVIRMFQLLAQP